AKELHNRGHKIIFGVNDEQKFLLEQELDFGKYIQFEGYNIQYPKGGNMGIKMLLESPKILNRIRTEYNELQALIDKHKLDLIIADNRFGLYTQKIPCTYITHQINIQSPNLIKNQLHKIHGKYINRYTDCWVPDSEGEINLGAELSHGKLHDNCSYIGPLSRFNEKATSENEDIDYLAIISGPEPQRSEFESIAINEFKKLNNKCAIVAGKPLLKKQKSIGNIHYFSHLNSNELFKIMCRSKKIICRPGYSTIMDLSTLQKPAHFIPTPGQTEQEYLAKLHGKENGWSAQNKLKISNKLVFKRLPEIKTNLKNLNGKIQKKLHLF
ncbi:MAG: hypothetical protein P8L20_10145, partial [Flavobacteriales bacterium]|nr:hypothetical protein [Flavobacteriales bacterium]